MLELKKNATRMKILQPHTIHHNTIATAMVYHCLTIFQKQDPVPVRKLFVYPRVNIP